MPLNGNLLTTTSLPCSLAWASVSPTDATSGVEKVTRGMPA